MTLGEETLTSYPRWIMFVSDSKTGYAMYPSKDEAVSDPCTYMAQLAQNILPLAKWDFEENVRFAKEPKIIYDSKYCRVSIVWGGWDYLVGNSINIYYGRLHAPNENAKMIWNGDECYCWHRLGGRGDAFDFLDGLTPQETVKREGFSRVIEEFRKSDLWRNLIEKRKFPEIELRMHTFIWKHYGMRLFELFDLRRPDLWEKYRQFLKEYYDIKGRSPNIHPSLDNVC